MVSVHGEMSSSANRLQETQLEMSGRAADLDKKVLTALLPCSQLVSVTLVTSDATQLPAFTQNILPAGSFTRKIQPVGSYDSRVLPRWVS